MDAQELQDPEKVSTIWVKPEQHCKQDKQHKIVDDCNQDIRCN